MVGSIAITTTTAAATAPAATTSIIFVSRAAGNSYRHRQATNHAIQSASSWRDCCFALHYLFVAGRTNQLKSASPGTHKNENQDLDDYDTILDRRFCCFCFFCFIFQIWGINFTNIDRGIKTELGFVGISGWVGSGLRRVQLGWFR